MHANVTHNQSHPTFRDFADATVTFLTKEAPERWSEFCDKVSDNFRVFNPKDFRVLAYTGYKLTPRIDRAYTSASLSDGEINRG